MRYMLQVRFNGADAVIGAMPPEEQQAVTGEFEAIRREVGVMDGSQLRPSRTAVTLSVNGGETRVDAGPAVEDRDALDGYYIYEAADIQAAIVFASRIPVARLGGTVEIRELVER